MQKYMSEVARLTALVGSIPEFARRGYELNVLNGGTLMGTVEAMKWPLWWKSYGDWLAKLVLLLGILIGVTLFIWFGTHKPKIESGLLTALLIIPIIFGLFGGCGLMSLGSYQGGKVWTLLQVFTDLEANLQALGFCSFMDLEYDMVHGRLRTVASDYFTIETRYGQACDNWRKLGLPRVSDLARSYEDANRILVQAIGAASKFGFNSSRGELLKRVEEDHALLARLATSSQS